MKLTPPILLLLLSLTVFLPAQTPTAQIAPHAGKTLTYQYTADVNGVTLWIDDNVSPGFIQYGGITCQPISTWQVNQVYPLPSATNRTQPAFSLQAACSANGVKFSVVETGFAYWSGYGRTAGVYYFTQSGTITVSKQ